MNLELILAFIVGAIIGGGVTFKLLPGFLKSIFRETARDELSEIQNEITRFILLWLQWNVVPTNYQFYTRYFNS